MRSFSRIGAALIVIGGAVGISTVSATAAPPKYHLVRHITLSDNGRWDYIAVSDTPHRLYVSRSSHVEIINLDNGKLVGTVENTPGVHGVAVNEKAGKGYTSNGQASTVTVFDVNSLKTLATVNVGKNPDAIIYDQKTNRVFTFNGGDNSSSVIDSKTDMLVGTIALPGRPEFAVSDQKGSIYDNIEDKSEIVRINAATLKVQNEWSIAPADGPSGLDIDKKNGTLFAVCSNNMMAVVDANNGHLIATPAIGNGPDAAGYDAKYDAAFSSNGQDGTITVLQRDATGKYQPSATVTTMASARTMMVDPKTHHLFVFGAKMMPVDPASTQPRWNRKAIPGSFTVLEYAP